MFILNPDHFSVFNPGNAKEFVVSWGRFYNINKTPYILGYKERIIYTQELNIGNPLTEENIIRLLRWKYPRTLTHSDEKPNIKVQQVIKRIRDLNNFRKSQLSEDKFKQITGEIFSSGHVFRVFLFHICKPNKYPIIDQFVEKAFLCQCHTNKNIPEGCRLEQMWESYQKYIEYFNGIYKALGNRIPPENNIKCIQKLKSIDNALMAFGQFLSTYNRGT